MKLYLKKMLTFSVFLIVLRHDKNTNTRNHH